MSFPARFNGQCAAACGYRIHEGDEIEKDADGKYRHVDCVPAPTKFDMSPKDVVCPDCFCIRPCRCLD
ncbi:hypothetical protein [Microbacterium sp. H6]|uniref:hypothetical protein n=1 Tax=Microbacterium sp. H6 TaxID=421122 RepID=UPI000DE56153|nr:hypothetical protein [Microbacterium sp. H6]RBO73491.1 hypothetical protein DSP71_04870 [Microbacterium sp. H6]